jgi:hypothetical protein
VLTCGTAVATNSVFVNMESILNCYCANAATSTADDDIGNVTFANVNNGNASPLTGNGTSINLYTDWTATVSPAQVTQGVTYTLSVTQINAGGFYTCGVRAFFDWNQDGDFLDANEGYAIGTTAQPSQLVSASILVPVTANVGLTRMRIVLTENGNPATMTPCGTYTWGETEDYYVNISAPVQLDPYPFALTAPANQSCFSNAETITVTVGNSGVAAIDFATNNLTVTATVTGPTGPQTATATLTSGTLAANGTQVLVLSPTFDMSAGGAYSFSVSTSMAGDGNAANNSLTATRTNIAATRPYNQGFTAAATPTGWTAPGWFYATNHGNGTNGIYQNLWVANPGPAQFSLPPIGTVQAGDGFSFDYRIVDFGGYPTVATTNGSGWGSIVIEVSTNCGGTWTNFATIDPGNHIEQTAWATPSYPLTAYVGQTVQFRFTVNYAAGDWYADFDNFNLTNCFPPANLTITGVQQTQATATWTGSGAALDYQWELYQGATLVNSGTTVGTSVNLTGLTANTAYSFRIRSNCGADQSAQVTATFTSGRLGEDCVNAADFTVTVQPNQAACGGTVVTSGNAQNGPSNVGCSAGSGSTPDDDVWAQFVAPANGNKLIITTSGISNTDWVMQVWSGCPSNGGQVIGCSDDVNGLMPQIEICQFDYTPGQTYYVRAWTWGAGGSGATMNLCVYEVAGCPLPPVNDNCANALPVPVNQPGVCGTPAAQTITGTTVAATPSATPNTTCAPFSTHFDVWYRFVSEACAPNYTASFQAALGATVGVALYQGNDCNTFTFAGCLANANGGFNLNNLTGGTVYYLRFYSTSAAAAGSFTFCMGATTAFPTNVIYVNDNAVGANTGDNWLDAYSNLQTALAAATAGQVLYVAEGTYYPSATGNRSQAFVMKNGVNLYGGFEDAGTTCGLADRDPVTNPTILSGDLGVGGSIVDNSFRVVIAKNTAACELNGFVVSGANSTTNGGGAWLVGDVAGQTYGVTIRRCVFENNRTTAKGGGMGILVSNSSTLNLTMDSCIFNNNIGHADGGGIGLYGLTNGVFNGTIDRSIFTGNQAFPVTTGSSKGGAITSWLASGATVNLSLLNSTFSNNTATQSGGALYLNTRGATPTNLTVTNCTFNNNSAPSGGAIFNVAQGGNSNSTITNSTFTGNASNAFSGGITNYTELAGGVSNHTVTNCVFNNNIGGAFANVSYKAGVTTGTVTRSRFANNTAPNGGAIYLSSALLGSVTNSTITNCVFFNNGASRDGGAFHVVSTGSFGLNTNIHSCTFHSNDAARRGGSLNNLVMKGGASNITATNTIFWQNPTNDVKTRSFHNEGLTASTTVNFCLLDSLCANNERGTGPFACNNSLTGVNPMFANAASGNLTLLAGSPAIDAGTATGAPAVDFNNGPRPQGAGFDIGAYEQGAVAPRLAQETASAVPAMDVKVFPNPTSGLFTLELGNLPTEEVTVQIFDLKGTLVSTRALFGENAAQFDLGGLSSGIYFVRIVAGDQIATQRVVLGARP